MEELTGLQNIFLQQFAVFGRPERISRKIDIDWMTDTTGMEIHRVVTASYFALINISETNSDFAIKNNDIAFARRMHRLCSPVIKINNGESTRAYCPGRAARFRAAAEGLFWAHVFPFLREVRNSLLGRRLRS